MNSQPTDASEGLDDTSSALRTDTAAESAPRALPAAHDVIVIGASAGGVEALQRLVRDLPASLPAAVFVVLHIAPQGPGLLPAILKAAGPMPATHPRDGQVVEMGNIYIAPPNYHMVLDRDIIRVVLGPKENRHRPAIDPLFRSAARHYGTKVIGVILTGMLDDGTAGLLAVKYRGGLAVVQSPADALYPDMPLNAMRRVKNVDYSVPLAEIGSLLSRLASEEPEGLTIPDAVSTGEAHSEQGGIAVGEWSRIEDEFALSGTPPEEAMNMIGTPSTIACPECHGTLWEIKDATMIRFRCRVGHAYTARSLLAEHSESLETALWLALRTLEESASLNRRLAERAGADHHLLSASSFMESAVESEHHAEFIRRMLRTNTAVNEQS